jgi:hypothetical protein
VQHVIGTTRHFYAHIESGEVQRGPKIPSPAWVEIQPDGDAFLLLYLDERKESLTDTWHQSLDQAKAQALHEFGIGDGDWENLET